MKNSQLMASLSCVSVVACELNEIWVLIGIMNSDPVIVKGVVLCVDVLTGEGVAEMSIRSGPGCGVEIGVLLVDSGGEE